MPNLQFGGVPGGMPNCTSLALRSDKHYVESSMRPKRRCFSGRLPFNCFSRLTFNLSRSTMNRFFILPGGNAVNGFETPRQMALVRKSRQNCRISQGTPVFNRAFGECNALLNKVGMGRKSGCGFEQPQKMKT